MKILLVTIDRILSSRVKAHEIFEGVKDEAVLLDFQDVELATPSFLHEMLSIAKENHLILSFDNVSESISFQLKKAHKALQNDGTTF